MPNIRKYQIRRVPIKGGEVGTLEIRQTGINVLRFINWGTSELRVSLASDPDRAPMAIVAGNGGTNNMMDPAGISRVYVYSQQNGEIGLVEMQVDDPMMILAMESVVSNLMTSLPPGTAHIGQVGLDVGSQPVSHQNPLPVTVTSGTTGLAPAKVTASAAGDQTVKAGGGLVWAIATGDQPVILKDGSAERWRVPANAFVTLPRPIQCSSSIRLNFAAAGDAWIMYE